MTKDNNSNSADPKLPRSNNAILEAANSAKHVHGRFATNSAILEATRTAKRMQDMLGSSSAMLEAVSSAKHMQDMLGSSRAILEATSSAKRIQDMLGSSSAMLEAVSSAKHMQEMLGSSRAILEATSSAKRMQEMLSSNSAMLEAVSSAKRIHEMLGSSRAILEATSSAKRMHEMLGLNTAIAEDISTTLKASTAFSHSLAALTAPANLSAAIGIIEDEFTREDYESLIIDNNISNESIDSSLQSLSAAGDSESFSALFARIPITLQIILIFIMLQIILPQLNSISANIITPYVNELISDIPDRDKVRALKKIDLKELNTSLHDLRFISRENVYLRNGPSIKSEPINILSLGQVVVFIEKNRNWTKVLVQYENGEENYGWVFSRYVEKFRN